MQAQDHPLFLAPRDGCRWGSRNAQPPGQAQQLASNLIQGAALTAVAVAGVSKSLS